MCSFGVFLPGHFPSVDTLEQMIGSFGPKPDGTPYSNSFPTEVSPSGMLARSGEYNVRSRVVDDDKQVYAGTSPFSCSSTGHDLLLPSLKISNGSSSSRRSGKEVGFNLGYVSPPVVRSFQMLLCSTSFWWGRVLKAARRYTLLADYRSTTTFNSNRPV